MTGTAFVPALNMQPDAALFHTASPIPQERRNYPW